MTGPLGHTVGKFMYLVEFVLLEENGFITGDWAIFINMEESILAHFTLRNRSWFCENENFLGDVKEDLKWDCLSFDWKIDFAFFLNCSAVSYEFV